MSLRTHGAAGAGPGCAARGDHSGRRAGTSRARPAAPDRQPRHRAARRPRGHDEEDEEAPGRRRGRVRHRHQRRRGDRGQDDHHHDPRHARDRRGLAEGGHGHEGRLQERAAEGARQDQGAPVADEGPARGQARGGALRADPRQGPRDVEAVEGRPRRPRPSARSTRRSPRTPRRAGSTPGPSASSTTPTARSRSTNPPRPTRRTSRTSRSRSRRPRRTSSPTGSCTT